MFPSLPAAGGDSVPAPAMAAPATAAGGTGPATAAGGTGPVTAAEHAAPTPGGPIPDPRPTLPDRDARDGADGSDDDADDADGAALPSGARKVDAKEYEQPFGRPGRPLRNNPFLFGLTAALGVLTAWLGVQAIASAGSALVLIVISLFLAIGLNPGVEWLQRHGISRLWAITIVFFAVIAFFVGFGLAVVPPLTDQTSGFVQQLPDYVQQLQNHPMIKSIDERYQVLDKLQQYVTSGNLASQMFGGLLGVASVVISALFSALTILVLTLYFLGSLNSIKETFYRLVPRSRRTRVRLLGDEILKQIGGYVAGNLIISLIAGVVTWIFLSIMQVPYALPLSIFVAITDLIPMIGAFLGAGVASGVAFLTSPQAGIACLIFFVIYQQVENYIISPPIFKSSVAVPPVATIVGALLGGALLGVVGALLGIPLAAAILLLIREVVFPRQERL
ncbi:AI-2E family transporter [Sphaerisporangium rufum]|uniref:AI-2E family transporter n=1 Tax=Sphaerisporangium rufum TaxID=1381558 RepID=UPI001EF37E2F|nr:AI-2E family transporter [Sphaerisporangium rufum]